MAASQDVELAALLSLRIKVIVEEGALFYDTSQPESERRTFAASSSCYEYEDEAYEGDVVFSRG
ncbi:hypothetical protein JY651_34195 [Pyxidicoccus parkwayensis]|uniref:Uncharacterized protein n=1 Tax=Pyxidicoccus parkwayensis TaxID=2813578 RepID=A0ABX7NNN3_9BACT|nr:hypothetical protein [Pyxidicoccus parkwaysis]QSQ20283.1 hypothetical protein JY651_34195 [Pyxidicoccus parkwaysis]